MCLVKKGSQEEKTALVVAFWEKELSNRHSKDPEKKIISTSRKGIKLCLALLVGVDVIECSSREKKNISTQKTSSTLWKKLG